MTQMQEDLLAPRFAALANPLDDSDWLDVVSRARVAPDSQPKSERRRRTVRRPLALAAALAIAAILAAASYAVVRYVIVGSPAPPRSRRASSFSAR